MPPRSLAEFELLVMLAARRLGPATTMAAIRAMVGELESVLREAG